MKRWLLGLAVALVWAFPAVGDAKVSLDREKYGDFEYEAEAEWNYDGWLEIETKAKFFRDKGLMRKTLKLEIDGSWWDYRGAVTQIEMQVNGGASVLLDRVPEVQVSTFGREMTLRLSPEAIDKIASLQASDQLTFVIVHRDGTRAAMEIPSWVLAEWLIVYNEPAR